ncbi:hypothetical protein CDL15_Pgr008816 [Punica granatum]|uniref:Ninja-family protein n=1 Tax=Punica granatum TaxID=22663 RepID=A0A218VXA6_PUNGR|nr:hypothetical protein CDL15_Pgr008816 [Punica granatum]
MSEADQYGMSQFDLNNTVEQNPQMQQQIVPPQGPFVQGDLSRSGSQICNAALREQPDLNLSLSIGGRSNGLTRSISLMSSLVTNERAPPPPRDFLSLSRSCSLPAGAGLHQQQQQHLQDQQELQIAAYLEYQRRRHIAESQWRLLLEQRMARERPILPSTLQHLQMAPALQLHQQVMTPAPHNRNQQVMVSPLMLPQQQVMAVQPPPLHNHQQQLLAQPVPLQEQQQHQVFVLPGSQGVPVPLSSLNNVAAAAAASVTTNLALYQALNMPAEGSSNSASAQMDLALALAANRGKQPMITRSEYAPLYISSSGSGSLSDGMAPAVEDLDSESVAKRMRLMIDKALADGVDLMRQMPPVAFRAGNEKRTEGFLYQYRKGEVNIVCSCHGTFLTPTEFVEHAGGADVDNPMKHIIVCSNPVHF